MASNIDKEKYEALKKARTFYKFTYRGLELEELTAKNNDELAALITSRGRRKFRRGMKRKSLSLVKKLRKAKKLAKVGEKPPAVRTHLRDMIVLPEMVGSVVAIYTGKAFQNVEVKGEQIGRYLAEFALSYKPVFHGRPGVAAIAARFIPV